MRLTEKNVKAVYIYPDGVTETLIWPTKWQPDATRTLLYMRFNNNLNDDSGNNVQLTNSGNGLTYGTIGNNYYAENILTGTNCTIESSQNLMTQIGAGDFTISVFMYLPSNWPNSNGGKIFGEWYDGARPWPGPQFGGGTDANGDMGFSISTSNGIGADTNTYGNTYPKGWHNALVTRVNNLCYLYVDGQLAITPFSSTEDFTTGSGHVLYIFGRFGYYGETFHYTGARMSELIYEKVGRSASDVLGYFNLEKGNYGIS